MTPLRPGARAPRNAAPVLMGCRGGPGWGDQMTLLLGACSLGSSSWDFRFSGPTRGEGEGGGSGACAPTMVSSARMHWLRLRPAEMGLGGSPLVSGLACWSSAWGEGKGEWRLTTRKLHGHPVRLEAAVVDEAYEGSDVHLADFDHLGEHEALGGGRG